MDAIRIDSGFGLVHSVRSSSRHARRLGAVAVLVALATVAVAVVIVSDDTAAGPRPTTDTPVTPPSVPAPRPAPLPRPVQPTIPSVSMPWPSVAAPDSTTPGCDGGYTRDELNRLIHDDPSGAGGVVGADYSRSQVLPDGRVLWVFQDVFVGADHLGRASFTHNAGLIQDGSCFELLRGKGGRSWIGGGDEHPLNRWFWPLDSVIDAQGRLAQFMVEMRNTNGTGAAEGAEPIAVWIATVSLDSFDVIAMTPAGDPRDRPLYGFSITSDDRFHYLYGNCYRQFVDPGYNGAHDTQCGPLVYVARVPIGQPHAAPHYWQGTGWASHRDGAVPISRRGALANPMQSRRVGDLFLAATKVDDWWGETVVIDAAVSAEGPFVEVARVDVAALCDRCNTYFAQLLPWTEPDGTLLVSISNNAWDMVGDAYPHPARYRPTVLRIPVNVSLSLRDGRLEVTP